MTDATVVAEHRDLVLTAENVAECLPRLLAPVIMKQDEIDSLSCQDQSTIVQAYLGALHEHDQFKLSRRVRDLTFDVLLTIKRAIPEGVQRKHFASLFMIASKHNFRSCLVQFLQDIDYKDLSDLYLFESMTTEDSKDQPLYVAKFALNSVDLATHGIPTLGEIKSQPCPSKRAASEEVARKVLSALRRHPSTSALHRGILDGIRSAQIENGRLQMGFLDVEKLEKPKPFRKKRRTTTKRKGSLARKLAARVRLSRHLKIIPRRTRGKNRLKEDK